MSAGFFAVVNQMAVMSKRAIFRTSGIIGDDLAINSKQLMGATSDRKLPMVYAVAKGSLKNKAILIPTALVLSVTLPWLIMPALTIGGAYLCYEGIDKFLHKEKEPEFSYEASEKKRIKQAIKTDFILSTEIVAVALWTVAAAPFVVQAAALVASGLAMTVGVYGFVGGLIKLDDVGKAMAKRSGKDLFHKAERAAGKILKHVAPKVIKTVGVIGTVAMFIVGGGMVLHGIPGGTELATNAVNALTANAFLQEAALFSAETVVGVAAGFAALPVMKVIEPPVKRAMVWCKKMLKKSGFKKAAAAAGLDVVMPMNVAPVDAPALKNMPDVKDALNTAARPPANENEPQPEIKAQPKFPTP